MIGLGNSIITIGTAKPTGPPFALRRADWGLAARHPDPWRHKQNPQFPCSDPHIIQDDLG